MKMLKQIYMCPRANLIGGAFAVRQYSTGDVEFRCDIHMHVIASEQYDDNLSCFKVAFEAS